MTGDIKTTLANLYMNNAKVFIPGKKFSSDYRLDIADLSKLEPVIGKKLRGTLNIMGNAVYDKVWRITGASQNLGGKMAFVVKDTNADVTIQNVSLIKLMYTLRYPKVFDAPVFGTMTYNLLTQKGRIETKLDNARLLPNQITVLLRQYANVDLTTQRYNQTSFMADLDARGGVFDFHAKSKNNTISIMDAKVLKTDNTIDAAFDIHIKEKDFSGTIKGDLTKPKVKLDTSKYLKKRVSKEINKFIDKTKEKFGIKDANSSQKPEDALKGLLKGLF